MTHKSVILRLKIHENPWVNFSTGLPRDAGHPPSARPHGSNLSMISLLGWGWVQISFFGSKSDICSPDVAMVREIRLDKSNCFRSPNVSPSPSNGSNNNHSKMEAGGFKNPLTHRSTHATDLCTCPSSLQNRPLRCKTWRIFWIFVPDAWAVQPFSLFALLRMVGKKLLAL